MKYHVTLSTFPDLFISPLFFCFVSYFQENRHLPQLYLGYFYVNSFFLLRSRFSYHSLNIDPRTKISFTPSQTACIELNIKDIPSEDTISSISYFESLTIVPNISTIAKCFRNVLNKKTLSTKLKKLDLVFKNL